MADESDSGPDDGLFELFDDIASVSDVEGDLLTDDSDDLQDAKPLPHRQISCSQMADFQAMNSFPTFNMPMPHQLFANTVAHRLNAQDASQLLSSIMPSKSPPSSAPGTHAPAPHSLNLEPIQPPLQPINCVPPSAINQQWLRSLEPASMRVHSHPSAFQNNRPVNTSPNGTSHKESSEKINIINNFVDWDEMKHTLTKTKQKRKPPPKAVVQNPPELHTKPVRIHTIQLKKFLRALKRSRKTAKQIQQWDKKMGLKKCHSRTMTKACTSRKNLAEVMHEISGQVKKQDCSSIAEESPSA